MIFQEKLPQAFKAQFFKEIGSTNETALSYIESVADTSCFAPIWIRAGKQTQGKGTKGRRWVSDCDQNLYCSLLFHPNCEQKHLSHLSLIAGIALYDTVLDLTENSIKGSDLYLKWPNDLMINEAKLAGILVETKQNKQLYTQFAVLGTGLNLKMSPQLTEKKTTCVERLGYSITPQKALEKLSLFTADWLNHWYLGEAFYDITSAWIKRAHILNKIIAVETHTPQRYDGHCIGCNREGQLLLKHQNKIIKIDFHKINSITLKM